MTANHSYTSAGKYHPGASANDSDHTFTASFELEIQGGHNNVCLYYFITNVYSC